MDGQILLNSLMSLKGTDLKLVYALLVKTSIGNLLSSKTKGLFSKDEHNYFMKHLEEQVKNLEHIEDHVLQVNLFLEITKCLQLRGTNYLLAKEIEGQCAVIVNEVYEQYKNQDKQFYSFVKGNESSSKLQQMIEFQMSKLGNKLDGSFQHFSGVTSPIAVLANPSFISPLLLGGGVAPINYQNKSLKKKLLPIILMQITIPFMSKGNEEVDYAPFISEWERRYNEYYSVLHEIEKIEYEKQVASSQIDGYNIQINEYNSKIASKEAEIRTRKQQIKSDLKFADLDALEISVSFARYRRRYQHVITKIKELKGAKDNVPTGSGFFKQIGSKIKGLSTSLDIREEEKKIDKMLDKMVIEVLLSTSAYQKNEREQILALGEDVKWLKNEKSKIVHEKQDQKQIFNSLKVNQRSNTQQLKQMERENHGLAHLR